MSDFDWALLEDEEVLSAIEQTVDWVAGRFSVEAADLAQEALLLTADPSKNLAECITSGDLGLFAYRLGQDLTTLAHRQVRVTSRSESYEDRYDEGYEGLVVPLRREVSGYDRDVVEALLPAIWDEDYCYGVRVETAPDPDMPRGTANKANGNSLGAHVADVQKAWRDTALTEGERRSIFLTYAIGWTQEEIAAHESITHQAVSKRLYSGVGRMVAQLNGDERLLQQIEEAA